MSATTASWGNLRRDTEVYQAEKDIPENKNGVCKAMVVGEYGVWNKPNGQAEKDNTKAGTEMEWEMRTRGVAKGKGDRQKRCIGGHRTDRYWWTIRCGMRKNRVMDILGPDVIYILLTLNHKASNIF